MAYSQSSVWPKASIPRILLRFDHADFNPSDPSDNQMRTPEEHKSASITSKGALYKHERPPTNIPHVPLLRQLDIKDIEPDHLHATILAILCSKQRISMLDYPYGGNDNKAPRG